MKLCPICKKNPKADNRGYCRECINKKARDRYKTDPEYRKREKERSRKFLENMDKDKREQYDKKRKEFLKRTGYQKSEIHYMSQIKSHMKKISKESLDEIITFIMEKKKEKVSV